MRDKLRLLIVVSVVCLLVAACTGNDKGAGSGAGQGQPAGGVPTAGPASYPRNETLYTSGNQWGPPNNWNPIMDWQYATGTEGLVYENLFLYDPLKGQYKPWLAEKGDWTSKNVYQLTLRDGLTWSDGKPLTAEDVVFTFELGKFASVPYHNLWNWLKSAEAVDARTVKFTFTQPLYQEWGNHLYNRAIVPKHLWENRTEKEQRVRTGDTHAALVFDGDDCLGWCQFGSPAELPEVKSRRLYEKGLTTLPDWRITCFFTGKGLRKRGVAHAALGGALAEIARHGGGTIAARRRPALSGAGAPRAAAARRPAAG